VGDDFFPLLFLNEDTEVSVINSELLPDNRITSPPFFNIAAKPPGIIPFFCDISEESETPFIMKKTGTDNTGSADLSDASVEIPIFRAVQSFVKAVYLQGCFSPDESNYVYAGRIIETAFKVSYLYPETLADNFFRNIKSSVIFIFTSANGPERTSSLKTISASK